MIIPPMTPRFLEESRNSTDPVNLYGLGFVRNVESPPTGLQLGLAAYKCALR